jgi:hypothetical protein
MGGSGFSRVTTSTGTVPAMVVVVSFHTKNDRHAEPPFSYFVNTDSWLLTVSKAFIPCRSVSIPLKHGRS